MAVPKQRHTKTRRNRRRMHIFLETPQLTKCLKCGKLILPHVICPNCGYYKGKEEIDVLSKLTKKERKKREKDIKEKDKETPKKKSLSLRELSRK